MPSQFERAAEILVKAKDDVLLTLQGHEHEAVSISIVSNMTRLINQLNFVTGKASVSNAHVDFPPVTNFLGDTIARVKEITKEDIIPTLTEKEIFLSKVNDLQLTIQEREPETLIRDFSDKDGILVLRKVAMRAGLEDAREATINIDFIERIKEGLTNNDLRVAEEEKINEKLAGPTAAQLVIEGAERQNELLGIGAKEAATTNDQLSTTKPVKVARTTRPNSNG